MILSFDAAGPRGHSRVVMHPFLVSAIDALRATGHPSAGQIARGLAELPDYQFARKFPPTPPLRYLDAAVTAPNAHSLVHEIAPLAGHLPWEVMSRDDAPPQITEQLTYCKIAGPDSLIETTGFRMGLYLQTPELFYPAHSHDAEEIYFVLSGTAHWQRGDAPFAPQSPGALIHHLANQPHAMHTHTEPLLAIWGWVGDIEFGSYRFE